MTSKEALEILYPQKSYLPYHSRKEKRYACMVIEKDLELLNAFKNALTIETEPIEFKELPPTDDYNEFISYCLNDIYEIHRTEMNKKIKEQLTRWVIENIDKEKIREWLEYDK